MSNVKAPKSSLIAWPTATSEAAGVGVGLGAEDEMVAGQPSRPYVTFGSGLCTGRYAVMVTPLKVEFSQFPSVMHAPSKTKPLVWTESDESTITLNEYCAVDAVLPSELELGSRVHTVLLVLLL
jgi:hypothetical protein